MIAPTSPQFINKNELSLRTFRLSPRVQPQVGVNSHRVKIFWTFQIVAKVSEKVVWVDQVQGRAHLVQLPGHVR